eukprot:15355869-Ditylum_brightwellii.AAC.1
MNMLLRVKLERIAIGETALKEETTPFTTQVVCEQTGTTYRDENPNDVMLPAHMGKHKVYFQWYWERGWIVARKRTAIGEVNTMSEFRQRMHDDKAKEPSWPTDCKSLQICSWLSFHEHWKKNYQNIKVHARGTNMCTNCCIFLNILQFGLEIIPRDEDKLEGVVDGALTRVSKRQQQAKKQVQQ